MSGAPFPGSLLSKQPLGSKGVFFGFYLVFEKLEKRIFFSIVHRSALIYFYLFIFISFFFYLSIHLFYSDISFSYFDVFIFNLNFLIYFILINSFVLGFLSSVTPDFFVVY